MKIAVILSGCGVFDGSEIYESVITLLALDRAKVDYECLAPDMEQMHVVNHLSGKVMAGESRNVLIEAARLARGRIKNVAAVDPTQYDALVIPGGFGAAKNLSNFATQGSSCEVQVDVRKFAQALHADKKPIGLICIAPALAPKIIGKGVKYTIGTDAETASSIDAMGGCHENCNVGDIVVDAANKLVTTPAYMLAKNISEAAEGINKLVAKVIELAL